MKPLHAKATDGAFVGRKRGFERSITNTRIKQMTSPGLKMRKVGAVCRGNAIRSSPAGQKSDAAPQAKSNASKRADALPSLVGYASDSSCNT